VLILDVIRKMHQNLDEIVKKWRKNKLKAVIEKGNIIVVY
jgi:hypothetical protein